FEHPRAPVGIASVQRGLVAPVLARGAFWRVTRAKLGVAEGCGGTLLLENPTDASVAALQAAIVATEPSRLTGRAHAAGGVALAVLAIRGELEGRSPFAADL